MKNKFKFTDRASSDNEKIIKKLNSNLKAITANYYYLKLITFEIIISFHLIPADFRLAH